MSSVRSDRDGDCAHFGEKFSAGQYIDFIDQGGKKKPVLASHVGRNAPQAPAFQNPSPPPMAPHNPTNDREVIFVQIAGWVPAERVQMVVEAIVKARLGE